MNSSMAQAKLYCFSCGAPVGDGGDAPVPVCHACTVDGQRVPLTDVHFLARLEGQILGPLTHEALVQGLLKGSYPSSTMVARERGDWLPIDVHPDFRAWFLPGTSQAAALAERKETRVRRRRAGSA